MRVPSFAVSCFLMLLAAPPLCGEAPPEKPPSSRRTVTVRFASPMAVSPLDVTRTAVARLLPEAPVLDGRLDDPCWKSATRLAKLSCVDTAEPATAETGVWLGHRDGNLYIAVHCAEEDPKRRTSARPVGRDRLIWHDDCMQILLDSRHDRGNPKVIAVSPSGAIADYTVQGRQKNLGWDIPCAAAGAPTKTGWAVEIAFPRAGLDDPRNDIIGFNIVRRRPGMDGEPFTWNPAPRAYEQGRALGNLIFETHPCTVQKVEVGRPYVGLNRLRIRLRNRTDQELELRAGLVSRSQGEGMDQSKYRLTLPAGKVVVYGVEHRFSYAGRCELALALTDESGKTTISRFSRPGLWVESSALVLEPLGLKDGLFETRFSILTPKRELKDMRMTAVFRGEGVSQLLGKTVVKQLTARSGTITVPIEQTDRGKYQLTVHLTRRGKTVAVASEQVVPRPANPE